MSAVFEIMYAVYFVNTAPAKTADTARGSHIAEIAVQLRCKAATTATESSDEFASVGPYAPTEQQLRTRHVRRTILEQDSNAGRHR